MAGWAGKLAGMSLRLSHLIGGDARSAHGGGWLDVFEPATGQVYAACPEGDAHDARNANTFSSPVTGFPSIS